MRTLFLLLLIVAMLCPAVAWATDVEGDVWGTWTKGNSPYNVIGEIRVPPGSTLVIEPGVLVNFEGHYKFIVDSLATLIAVGTETDSIYFTTDDLTTGWHGVRFMYASSNSQISYSRMEYGRAFEPWPDNLGGAIYCYYSSPIISHNTIRANSANQGGGIYCDTLSSPTINSNSIAANLATSMGRAWGGGICCCKSTPRISTNCITGNSTTAAYARGGGISCRESSPIIDGNSISVNSARGTFVGSGGGISCYESSPTITNNSIAENWVMAVGPCDGHGGGIACEASSHPQISSNTISGNSADSTGGGGISCWASNAEIVDNTITENRGNWQGGGILCAGSSPAISNNIIEGNSAGGGGGICCESSSPTITENIIRQNSAGEGGGINCRRSSSPTIANNNIIENLARTWWGGGIYSSESSPTIENNSITANVAAYAGGGIANRRESNGIIGSNSILRNTAPLGGGVFCSRNSSPMIEGNQITGNGAIDAGGGVYCGQSSPTIMDNTIRQNSGGHQGGGIAYTNWSGGTMTGNTISLNSAQLGGGVFCLDHSSPTVTNATISRNSASEKGGGLHCLNDCSPSVINCILWEDDAPLGPEICAEETSEPYVRYCDVEGGWPGIENIDCNPLFRDPESGDFQITWENYPTHDSTRSGCIDSGDPNSTLDPDNTRADIGALYFHQYAARMTCECLTPTVCRGKNLYFKVVVTNCTVNTISGTITFRAYADFDCDPQNILITIPRFRTYDPGENIAHYFFKVPGLVPPDEYSISVEGRLRDSDLFSCMNSTVVQCEPWKTVNDAGWQLVEVGREEAFLPTAVSLEQNYPNPFNATTNIDYQLPVDSQVRLEVYNVLGEKVATLADEKQQAGYKSVIWDASELSSGLYFYKLTAGDYTETKRMMLVK